MIRFGVHCSLRKGLSGALDEARRLGCEALQIFTRSPRMWHMRTPAAEEVDAFVMKRKTLNLYPLIVHTPYLPNLATTRKKLYALSCKALQEDLAVSKELKTDYLVIHPGAYSPGSTMAEGISQIGRAINCALEEVQSDTVILFENVAGGGRRVGSDFRELSAIMEKIKYPGRTGICLDTAHAFAAGFDLSTSHGTDALLEQFDKHIGLEYLKIIHFNDSLVPLGSRKDRHQHLGKGYIGETGFKYFIRKVKDLAEAGVIETPKDTPAADKRNLSLLFKWRGSAA